MTQLHSIVDAPLRVRVVANSMFWRTPNLLTIFVYSFELDRRSLQFSARSAFFLGGRGFVGVVAVCYRIV